MTLEEINALSVRDAVNTFRLCCGSSRWAEKMKDSRPFRAVGELYASADEIWFSLTEKDWKEAFARHPKIGDIKSLRKKFQGTKEPAAGEQAAVDGAPERLLKALAEGNKLYEAKFGYIFIVCATGKSAAKMLAILNERLNNTTSEEIKIAAEEQAQITRIRLEKLLTSPSHL